MTKTKSKTIKNNRLSKKTGSVILAGLLTLSCSSAMAIDTTFSLHKGEESKTLGVSLALSDNFSKGSNFYWSVGYSSLNDVKIEFNDTINVESEDDLFFKTNTIEGSLSYRQKLKSYNSFLKKITIEYQLGASVSLTDNKYVWTDPILADTTYEESVSESGDINPLIALSTYYNVNKKTAIVLGLKYQPSFSEFGDVSSLFLGVNYKFGKAINYK